MLLNSTGSALTQVLILADTRMIRSMRTTAPDNGEVVEASDRCQSRKIIHALDPNRTRL